MAARKRRKILNHQKKVKQSSRVEPFIRGGINFKGSHSSEMSEVLALGRKVFGLKWLPTIV